jgi:hypothetical protein
MIITYNTVNANEPLWQVAFPQWKTAWMVLQMPILLEVDSKRGQVGSERASIELRRRLGVNTNEE